MQVLRAIAPWLAIGLLWLVGSCEEKAVTAVDVVSVTVDPPAQSVPVGVARRYTAHAFDASGRELRGRTASWSVVNTAIASVDPGGMVSGLSVGTTTLVARIEGQQGLADVNVTPANVAAVGVVPVNQSIRVAENLTYQAILTTATGDTVRNRPVTWSTSDPAIASIDVTGRLTALRIGNVSVRATAEGVTGQTSLNILRAAISSITVSPLNPNVENGATLQLQGTARASDNSVIEGVTFNWSSANPTIATVDGAGRVTGRALGSARIDATADGRTGSTTVSVIQPTIARVIVTPSSSSVVILGTVQLNARLESADGTEIKGPTITWSSSNTTVAQVDQTGLVTGHQVGSVTITASAQGRSGTGTIFVADRLIASIDVVPAATVLLTGDSAQFSAVVRASDGSILLGRTIVWTSSIPSSVSVNPVIAPTTWARTIAAQCPDQSCPVVIRATAEGRTDSAVITVAKRVATLVITPPNDTLAIGASQQFSATLRASDNTVLTLRGIAWSSTHPAAVALSRPTGDTTTASALALPAPCAVGQTHCVARIIATSEGRADTANISVPRTITQVQVTPANPTVNPGSGVLLTARALAADGTDLTGSLTFSWASSSTNITLSPAGNGTTKTATGLANPSCPAVTNTCTATVTATLSPGGTAGSTTVGVRKPVTQVVISPDSLRLNAGQTLGVSALVRATDNSSITDRVVTWVSANTAIATATGVGAFQLTANVAGLANPTCTGDPCSTTVRATTETWPGSGTTRADTIPVRVYKAIDSVQIRVNGVRVDSVTVKVLATQAVTAVVFAGTTAITRPVGWFESSASFSVNPATGPGTTITAGALPAAPAPLTAVACPVGVTPSLTCPGGRTRSINVRVSL